MTLPVPGDVAPGPVPRATTNIEELLGAILGRMSEDQRRTLYSAVISAGGLTVQDGGAIRVRLDTGVEIFYAGPLELNSVEYQGLVMRRADDSNIFITFPVAGDPENIAWAFLDQFGGEVVSSDAITGGMARPWIPINLLPKISMAAGVFDYYNLAVSGTERQLWEGRIPLVSHPYVEVDGVWGQASGTNTTTYRLKVWGVTVGSWTVGGGLAADRRGPFDISANLWTAFAPIELTAQSTGTGNAACHIRGCALRQTP